MGDRHNMPDREDGLLASRQAKLERVRQLGIDPYPARFERTCYAAAAIARFEAEKTEANLRYLDEVITDDAGGRMFVCSDTDFCAARQAEGHRGRLSGEDAA